MGWPEQRGPDKWRGAYRVQVDGKWQQRYVKDDDGQPVMFTSKAKATRAANAAEQRERDDEQTKRKRKTGERMRYRDWVAEVNSHRTVSTRQKSYLRLHLEPQWGDWWLDEIDDRVDTQEWVYALMARRTVQATAEGYRQGERTLAPGTVHRIYYEHSGYMKKAVKANKIPFSPCQFIDLPKLPPPDERFLTPEEYARLYAAIETNSLQMRADLGVGTGCRFGEIAGLHRHRIDTQNKLIVVHETWDTIGNRIKGYPKSGKRRGVPITSELALKLDRYMADHPAVPCTESHIDDQGNKFECSGSLLLAKPNGRVIRYEIVHDEWTEAVARSGLGHVRLHDLRHTYASWCIQRGVSKDALKELLGHSSVIITERYAHLAGAHWPQVRAALGDTLTLPPQPPTPTPGLIVPTPGLIIPGSTVSESAPQLLPADGDGEGALIIPFRRPRRSAS